MFNCLNVQFLKCSTVEIFAVCVSPAVRSSEREEEDVAAEHVVLNLVWVGRCLRRLDRKDKRRLDKKDTRRLDKKDKRRLDKKDKRRLDKKDRRRLDRIMRSRRP